jgi:serine/threonine protein kinase
LEHVEGGTLAARIAGNPQPIGPAATLVEHLARTLAYIHQRGILHGDLKPYKVLLAVPPTVEVASRADSLECEEVYGIPVIDGFELALDSQRILDLKEGEIRGTPAYMAPEQASGRHRDLGPATDIHGLGAVLYELWTGRPPFRGQTILETLQQAQAQEPAPPRQLQPTVPRELEAICRKCLHKEPARRYSSGLELASELRGFTNRFWKKRWFW